MTPPYLLQLRPVFPNLCDAEIELMLWESNKLRAATGLSAYEHLKRGLTLLFPSRDWHPWKEERIRSVDECITQNIKELSWMGAASSGKSSDVAEVVLALWFADPRHTTVYVTSPFKDATDKNIWSVIVERFEETKIHNPNLPGEYRSSQKAIVLNEKGVPRSFLQMVTGDEVGKLKGKKAISTYRGRIVILAEELPVFPDNAGANLMKVTGNLKSNRNILIISTGNFQSTGDSFARMTAPDERDIPGGWWGFDPDRHFRWRTDRGGLALRFDGLQSPNLKAGRDIYPYLTTNEFVAMHAAAPGGLRSPDAMCEVRSAPVTSLDEFTITNHTRIKSSGAFDKFKWTGDEITRGAFCDAGLGGDAAEVQPFLLGWMQTPTGKKQVVAIEEGPYTIPVQATGHPDSVEVQLARGLKEYCEGKRLLPQNVGYDAAMRPALAQAIGVHYSLKARAIDSNGAPTDRKVSAAEGDTTWKDKVDRLVSEFWFATASLIDSGQLRGLNLSPKAVDQLCTRRWERKGKKKSIQTKLEYKNLLKSMGRPVESPNEADALVGCVEMARRLGLGLEGVSPGGGAVELLLNMMKQQDAKRVYSSLTNGRELPSGRLHATYGNSQTAKADAGRLNRRF